MNKQTAIALTCWSVLDAASSVQWVALNPWGDIVAGYTTREGRFETSVIRLQGMPKARRHRRAAVRALGRIHAKKMA